MKTLLWKDFRQNLRMLIAVGMFLLMPYVLAMTIGVANRLRPEAYPQPSVLWTWSEYVLYASLWSLGLLVAACAFIAGNALAGERADRSAEFAVILPIARGKAVASKAILALTAFFTFAAANTLIAVITWTSASEWIERDLGRMAESVPVCAALAMLIFGVAWLVSALLRQPAIAAASGIAAAVLVFGTLGLIDFLNHGDGPSPMLEHWLVPLSVGLGVAAFVAGAYGAVRRVEP